MPHHEHLKIEGRIDDVFFHRFVVVLRDGRRLLADLTPRGLESFPIETGMEIVAEGEMKPSELKIERIARRGGALVEVAHKKPLHHDGPHRHHAEVDPAIARRVVEAAGLAPLGEPRRKPKHFEVLARRDGRLVECHVELDGRIRKEKPVDPHEPKWSEVLAAA